MKQRINITIEYDLLCQLKNETKHIKNLSAFFEKCLENSINNYKEKNGMLVNKDQDYLNKYGMTQQELIKIIKGRW